MFTTAPLFGKFHSPRLHQAARPLRQPSLHHLENLLAGRLDPALLAPNPSHTNSRRRLYPPHLSFLAFLDQILNPNASCREAVRQIRAYYRKDPDAPRLDQDCSAYCQARARWSLDELVEIRRSLADHTVGQPGLPPHLPQRSLKVIDGTSLNLPDTPANRQAYSQSKDQKPGCGFPLVRLVALFSLETGAVLERAWAPYTTSENALSQQLWPTLQRGDLLLGDRNFGSWSAIAALQQRGVDTIFRLHASRNHDFRRGLYLRRHERLILCAKPRNKPANLTAPQWADLPERLTLRLVRFRVPTAHGRSKKITLLTTLTDPLLWPLELLAALYARRWHIELYFDDIKTTLHLDMLSCLSPAMAHKELEMHLIAYNLIRSLMGETACVCHVPLDRLSFKGTLDTARQYSHTLAQIPRSHRQLRQAVYADMLAVIAEDLVPQRPDRFEPRCRKRRPKRYPLMTQPRPVLKAAHLDSIPLAKRPPQPAPLS